MSVHCYTVLTQMFTWIGVHHADIKGNRPMFPAYKTNCVKIFAFTVGGAGGLASHSDYFTFVYIYFIKALHSYLLLLYFVLENRIRMRSQMLKLKKV